MISKNKILILFFLTFLMSEEIIKYYPNKQIHSIQNYNEKGFRHGKHTHYYNSGKPLCKH